MSDAAFPSSEPWDRKGENAGPAGERKFLALLPVERQDDPNAFDASFTEASAAPARRDWRRWRGAASLAVVALIGAAAVCAQVRATWVASAEQAETQALGHRLDSISATLQALDAKNSRDELSNLNKSFFDFKASALDLNGAVVRLSARVERLERDQTERLDKLGDKLDKDAAQRLADIAQRLDRLEAKSNVAVVPKSEPPKAAPNVALETTGSIEKTKLRLHDMFLTDIHDGYAMIDGPEGEFEVAPGDKLPGGGRVLRIERHGREWVVVTTLGEIASTIY